MNKLFIIIGACFLTLQLSHAVPRAPMTDSLAKILEEKGFEAVFDEIGRIAKQYSGDGKELSDITKWAIVTGNTKAAEKFMIDMYTQVMTGDLSFGRQVLLYQLFLLFIDLHNSHRDEVKAEKALRALENQFPNRDKAIKARAVFNESR